MFSRVLESMLPSLARLSLRRKSANDEKVDILNVTGVQEIEQLIMDSLMRDNASTLCKDLNNWCATHKMACTPEVYQAACAVFGIDTVEKANYLRLRTLYSFTKFQTYPPKFFGWLSWKGCFRRICMIYASDINRYFGPAVQLAGLTPFELVQREVELDETYIADETSPSVNKPQLIMARCRSFIPLAALGPDRDIQKRLLMTGTHRMYLAARDSNDPADIVSIFADLRIPLDPSIYVQISAPNDNNYALRRYRRLDFALLTLRTGNDGTQWAQWLVDVALETGTYTFSARNKSGYNAIENLTLLQRSNTPDSDRSGMFVVLLTHPGAFKFKGLEKETLLHVLFSDIFTNDQWEVAQKMANIEQAVEAIFAEARKRGPQTVKKVFFARNAAGILPSEEFKIMMGNNKFLKSKTSIYKDEKQTVEAARRGILQVFRDAMEFCGFSNSSDAGPSGSSGAGPSGASGAGPSGASE